MHVLAGLDRPTQGSVRIAGQEITDLDDKRLTELRRDKVGFIFQFFNLLPVLSAEENIRLPLSIAGRDGDPELFDKLVSAVDLGDRLSHRPSELSGGQQQRVAVARALVSKPAVVFADEPTGNLDSGSSEEVLALLRRAVDEFGQTVVMVTHDASAAVGGRPRARARGRQDRPGRRRRHARAGARPAQGADGMTAVALRNLGARKLRTFLTSLAVILGIMMVAGTYVLTDTIDQSFDKIFTESNEGIDAVVTSREAVDTDDGSEPSFPASVLEKVRATEGVGKAQGGIFDQQVAILDKDGDPIGGNGAPTFGASDLDEPFDAFTYVQGGKPKAANQVVIDKQTADRGDFALGDRIKIAGKEAARTYGWRASPSSAASTPSAAPASPCSRSPRPSASRARRASSTRSAWPPTGSRPRS